MVFDLIYTIFYVVELLILVRCFLSFLPLENGFTRWVYMAAEPLLSPCRRLMERFFNTGLPIDFSPILALLLLQLLQRIIFIILNILF